MTRHTRWLRFTVFMVYGVKLTNASNAGITMAGIPTAVALMSGICLGDVLKRARGWRRHVPWPESHYQNKSV